SGSFSSTVGAAAKLAFTTQPSGGAGGTSWSTQPTVAVQDAAGNTVTTSSAVISLTLTSANGGTLSCSSGVMASSGVATFGGCNVDKPGSYTLTAATGSLTSATSNSVTITVGAATKLAFTAQPSGGASSAFWATQPVVSVQDAFGNTVTGSSAAITLALTTPGGATLTCGSNPLSASSGVATFTACRADQVGSYTLTASSGALTAATSSSFAVTAGAATKLVFATQPNSRAAGVVSTSLLVQVKDVNGNTVTNSAATVTQALTTPNGATLTCSTSVTVSNGAAVLPGCSVDKAGTYTLTASADSLTSAVSSSFTISAGNSAAKLVFTTQPDGGLAGTTWPTRPAVTVQDAYGNTYTASGFYVALALTTPGGATLRCTPQYNTILATGVGTFAGCKADKVGTYTLTATSSGLTSAISSSFTITAAAAAKLAFTTQPAGAAASAAFTTQPEVTVQDASGNPVTSSGAPITLTLTTPGGAALTCTSNPQAASSGVATFAGCAVDKPGSYTLTAASTGLSQAESSTLVVAVGAAAKLAFTTQPSSRAPPIRWPRPAAWRPSPRARPPSRAATRSLRPPTASPRRRRTVWPSRPAPQPRWRSPWSQAERPPARCGARNPSRPCRTATATP
ncbi:MAG: hypothetical protein NTW72_01190, partial [Gemmatimonadetes bacterium]|nr:hypothetical protein [Gemmatimonadota bacterium]